MDSKDLLKRVKEDGIKFVSLQFSDVTGAVKSVDMPIKGLEEALGEGVWFDGSSVEGFARIQESDMRLVLDPDTYAVLPWAAEERKRGRIFCDIYTPDGVPFEGDPRGTLKRLRDKIAERGWTLNIGPEPEFFLFRRSDGNGDNVHPVPHDVGGYFDFSPSDEAVRVRTELMDSLNTMGLEIEVGHHEVALGQHEIDFRFADALKAADNVMTLKYTVKAIAAKRGLVASFMPKPIFGINGSGMHCHQSLFDAQGNNLFFDDKDEFKISKIAYGFIAGQLKHARASGSRGRTDSQFLQAPGARLRSSGLYRLGTDQPLGTDPHPALHGGTCQVHAGRTAFPRSILEPVPGFLRHAGRRAGWHR